ncbi:MAG: 50S ribosomal protein L18 [Oscillospiraceae bacterium]|nr:50S ribosomal protein L18 [Oscillospiraceae bacterium]
MLDKQRAKRHRRVRGKIFGTAQRPRLNVFRSAKNIYAQIIDDVTGTTLVSASSTEKDFGVGGNKDAAEKVGMMVGKRAIEKGIDTVVFDRGGYLYHGRVEKLAEGARKSGLKF